MKIEFLTLRTSSSDGPNFREARIFPHLGMNVGALVDNEGRDVILPLPDRLERPEDAYHFGGAFLIPFANRLRKEAGGPVVALHGFLYHREVKILEQSMSSVRAKARVGDFEGRWKGDLELDFEISLATTRLSIHIVGTNMGSVTLPLGIGWHPYLTLSRRAKLKLHARSRLERGSDLLPTGRKLAVPDSPDGLALDELKLDDCFTDLTGPILAELIDPERGVGYQIASRSQGIRAVQVYTPPGKAAIAIEPQFNFPDPLNSELWGQDSGLVHLTPGASASFDVDLSIGRPV